MSESRAPFRLVGAWCFLFNVVFIPGPHVLCQSSKGVHSLVPQGDHTAARRLGRCGQRLSREVDLFLLSRPLDHFANTKAAQLTDTLHRSRRTNHLHSLVLR